MDTPKFSWKEAVAFGWDTMKANLWFFVGLLAAATLIKFIPSQLAEMVKKDNFTLYIIFTVVSVFFGILIDMGLLRTSLKMCSNEKGDIFDLFNCYPLFFKYLFAWIIYTLICIAGFLLLIVPGVIWSVQFGLFGYFMIDKGLGPIEALKESSRITKGSKGDLFVFYIICVGINILGVLALILGLFAAIPTTMIAAAFVYRKLAGVVIPNQANLTAEIQK